MFEEYVNILDSISDNKKFTAIVGISGMFGITVGGLIRSLFMIRDRKKLERSNKLMRSELLEKDKIILNYEVLLAKENEDLRIFRNSVPHDHEVLHAIYHRLLNLIENRSKIDRKIFHLDTSYESKEYNAFWRFISAICLLIARNNLVSIEEYSCARKYLAVNILYGILNKKFPHLNPGELGDNKIAMSQDEGQIDFIYRACKQMGDLSSMDILLSARILLIDINGSDFVDANRRSIDTIADEINSIYSFNDKQRDDWFLCLSNTIVAIGIFSGRADQIKEKLLFRSQFDAMFQAVNERGDVVNVYKVANSKLGKIGSSYSELERKTRLQCESGFHSTMQRNDTYDAHMWDRHP